MKITCLTDYLLWKTDDGVVSESMREHERLGLISVIPRILTNNTVNFVSVSGFETGVSIEEFLNEI